MTINSRRPALAGILCAMFAALAATGCKQEAASDNQAAAGAPLLPRSTTDDMPAYDTVRSQSPHMSPEPTAPGKLDTPIPAATSDVPDKSADAADAVAAEVEASAATPREN